MRLWGRTTLSALSAILLGACGLPTGNVRTSQLPDYALASCDYVVEANLAGCSARASERRNGEVAMAVATYLAQKPDPARKVRYDHP